MALFPTSRLPRGLPLPPEWLGRLNVLANGNAFRAIREGLLWVVPVLLLSEVLQLLVALGRHFPLPLSLNSALQAAQPALEHTIPLLIAGAIGYFLALNHRLPRLPVAFLSLSLVAVAAAIMAQHPRLLSVTAVAIALMTPLTLVPLLSFLSRQRWLPKMRQGIVNDNLWETFNILPSGLLAAILFIVGINALSEPLTSLVELTPALPEQANPYLSGLLVSGLNSLLWLLGIHGYHALTPVFLHLQHAVELNAIDLAYTGSATRILNASQMAAFVFIGGSGATFSLALCLALTCRNRTLKLLGLASLPLSFMNVNEILLFGLPIILSPRLAIPFVIAPMLNVLLSLAAISLGFVSPASVPLPMTSPVLLNAYWASGGEINAVLLQVGLIFVSCWVYLPFVRVLDARGSTTETITVRSLDTTFTRLHEEASLYSYDPVSQANTLRHRQAMENRQIRLISEYEFFLEYQPQVSLSEGDCNACEALLRARAPSGQIRAPAEFLQWLERVGLIRDLDLWVAQRAVDQYRRWQAEGFATSISINVTGHTISDPLYRRRLAHILAPVGPGFVVEVTESSLVGDTDEVEAGIRALHDIGVKLAIDDFGTGYSALSYLHRFDIDKIKIDRSFVLASATPRGQRLLDGLLAFSEELELDIVVEGVETEVQREALHTRNDLLIQGWLYSKSLAPEAFRTFVEARRPQYAL